MQGTLKRLGENFGFFTTDDGDVFVQRRNLLPDARNGDIYEFETEPGDPCPAAINLRFNRRGAPPARRDEARQGGDRPARERNQKITAVLTLEDAEVRDFPNGKKLVVPLTLSAKRGSGPAAGLDVIFFVNGIEDVIPRKTDDSGHTFYDASTDADAKNFLIIAVVKDGNRDVGVFSQRCKNKKKTCKHIKVEILMSKPGYFDALKVVTLSDDQAETGMKAKFQIHAAEEIRAKLAGVEKTGLVLEFESDDKGETTLNQVEFVSPNSRGNIYLCSDHSVRFGPYYIRKPK